MLCGFFACNATGTSFNERSVKGYNEPVPKLQTAGG